MRNLGLLAAVAILTGAICSGCAPSPGAKATLLESMLVSPSEASAHGGWTVTAGTGPVDGDSADCSGKPFSWPKVKLIAHASQFLDEGDDDSIAVIVKQLDGAAAADVTALRAALKPCAPTAGVRLHGAMLQPVGEDSFAYQSMGTDDTGEYTLDDTLIACGHYEMEAIRITYSSGRPDQAGVESVLHSAIRRMLKAGHCSD